MVRNLKKRALSLIMAVLLIATLVPTISFAATIAEDYGLASSDARIRVCGDWIAVFSHPTDPSRYIKSETVVSALTAAEGYTISYVDASKAANASANVKDGYIKLAKDGSEDVYIPITPRGETFDDQFKDSTHWKDSGWSYNTKGGTFNHQHGGIGGKSADDYAYSITVGEGTEGNNPRLERTVQKGIIHTMEFNMYADGDASAYVGYTYSNTRTIKWDPDGKVYIDKKGTLTHVTTLERGKWHNFAVSHDVPRGRYRVYIDGVQYTDTTAPWTTDAKFVAFGVVKDTSNGMVAFDDLDAYYGYYLDGANVDFTPSNSISVMFDQENKVVKYDEYVYSDISALLSDVTLLSGAQYVNAFADSTLSVPATEITEDTVLVFKDSANEFHYYTLESLGDDYIPTIADIGLTSSNNQVKIGTDSIAVLSENISAHSSYFISSEKLCESLTSSVGYTFSYVDVNKEAAEANSVVDGYVLATSPGGRKAYYPIVRRFDFTAATPYRSVAGGSKYSLTAKGGAGKDDSDTCEAWSAASAGTAITQPGRSEWKLFGGANADGVYTVVFNVRADGDAVPAIYYRYSDFGDKTHQLFKWNADGEWFYHKGDPNAPSAFSHVSGGVMDRSRWQQVAITFDYPRGRYHIYVNGKLMTETTAYLSPALAGQIRYGITAPTTNGTAYFDDIETYYGYYYAEDYAINANAGDVVALRADDKEVYYDASVITDAASLVAQIKEDTDASVVKAFADATLTTEATTIDESTVVMAISANGKRYTYYKPVAETEAKYDFKLDGHYLVASIDRGLANGEDDVKLIAIAKNENGNLYSFTINDVEDNGSKFEKKLGYNPKWSYRVFFWGDNLAPLCPDIEIVPASAE